MKFLALIFPVIAFTVSSCTHRSEVLTEFPTPPPPAAVTPLPRLAMTRNAELEAKFQAIAADAKGKVGVAAVMLDTGDAAFLNAEEKFPMQSVYKLPIAMATMDKVRAGELALDEKIGVNADDMVRKGMRSPLRDGAPNGGEFTIKELVRLALVESDGTASDVLIRILGEPSAVQSYLTRAGISDMRVLNYEKEIGRDWKTQYENWSTPMASVDLLRMLFDRGGIQRGQTEPADENLNLVLSNMNDSVPGAKRLRGLLRLAIVPHKTGTSGTQNGLTAATNDIGLIYLPDQRYLAIAVFVSDSTADESVRESVIASIAKAAVDTWAKENGPDGPGRQ